MQRQLRRESFSGLLHCRFDPIWIEAFVPIRSYNLDWAPECVIRRLEQIASPRGHSQFVAWSDVTPEFAHSHCHIRHKENSEHAYDGIKTCDWKRHREHIADFEFDVAKTPLNCFRPRRLQKRLGEINSYDCSRLPHCLCGWKRGRSGPTTNIEHSRTNPE